MTDEQWQELRKRFVEAVEAASIEGADTVTITLNDAAELSDAIYEMDKHLPDFFQG